MIFGVPWWVFLCIVLIFISGYMAFRSMIAEKKIEQQFIEQEGKFYMERIQEEKSKRNEGDDHHQITSS
ncbi:sporulation YhaL family protein [Aquibacillus sediminis]|uniref:sporulation YhaL family protein n=1 Tax=Aquibacillus sediminis TaxID=2574734 RepID=UPI0011087134|nr:sporulation YhaL family protein [Aquibacillus sediminis]